MIHRHQAQVIQDGQAQSGHRLQSNTTLPAEAREVHLSHSVRCTRSRWPNTAKLLSLGSDVSQRHRSSNDFGRSAATRIVVSLSRLVTRTTLQAVNEALIIPVEEDNGSLACRGPGLGSLGDLFPHARECVGDACGKNAPILILDEPTSSVGIRTEDLIMEALQRLLAGRTSFTIAHRANTLKDCGMVLCFEAGRVTKFDPATAVGSLEDAMRGSSGVSAD
jgi:hypothetical protein